MKKMFGKKMFGYIALALACILAGTAVGTSLVSAQADPAVVTSPFTEAIAKVRDSVVGVYNYQVVNNYNNNYGNGYYGFPWNYFGFGYGDGYGYGYGNGGNNPDSSKEVHAASGSGVVIADGYVLTNYHVIEDAHSLKIAVVTDDSEDPELYDATVAATDSDKDVAVLYAPDLKLTPVALGDSDSLVIGDWAILIGNPLGFTGTVSAGIVSALDREIENSDKTKTDRYGRTSSVVNKMIQTDAAINSGNSGGGMFNVLGELVGIPTLKYSGSRYSNTASVENIGMCIPINEAKDVIDRALNGIGDPETVQGSEDGQQDVKSNGELNGKPRMGISVAEMIGGNTGLPRGAYVISVDAGGPAEAAGMLQGDIVVEINGEIISTVSQMTGMIAGMNSGDVLNVKVFRPDTVMDASKGQISTEGDYVDLQVTLAVVDPVAQ